MIQGKKYLDSQREKEQLTTIKRNSRYDNEFKPVAKFQDDFESHHDSPEPHVKPQDTISLLAKFQDSPTSTPPLWTSIDDILYNEGRQKFCYSRQSIDFANRQEKPKDSFGMGSKAL